MTWNIWGVPWITPALDARVAAVGPALLELQPDVVLLQEVWRLEDGRVLGAALQEGGLPHVRHFQGPERSSGLLVASRYPILEERFEAFSLGGVGYIPFHLDWMCDKGIARVDIETPLGRVVIGATHMQGSYRLDSYPVVRVTQALEAAVGLGSDGAPVIVGGDLNSPAGDLPFDVFGVRGGLAPTAEGFDIDSIFARSGDRIGVRVVEARRLLEEPLPVAGHDPMPLSDHPAILADLVLSPALGPAIARLPDPGWPTVRRQALEVVRDGEGRTETQLLFARAGALAALVGLLGLALRTRRWTRRIGSLVAAALLGWLTWFGLVYGPDRLAGLAGTAQMLSDPGSDAFPGSLPTGP